MLCLVCEYVVFVVDEMVILFWFKVYFVLYVSEYVSWVEVD